MWRQRFQRFVQARHAVVCVSLVLLGRLFHLESRELHALQQHGLESQISLSQLHKSLHGRNPRQKQQYSNVHTVLSVQAPSVRETKQVVKSNLTKGCITTVHRRFNPIHQVAPICTHRHLHFTGSVRC